MRFLAALCLLLASFPLRLAAQSDPQAVALASKAYLALTGGQDVQSISISSGATWTAGSDDFQGTAQLEALGTGNSRVQLSLGSFQRTEIRNNSPQGAWVDSTGQTHPLAQHNLMTDAAWFFPALSAMFGPNVTLSYVGTETLDAASVQHIRVWQSFSGAPADVAALLRQLSTTDVYLDGTSLLPVGVRFAAHPDNDENLSIPVEVRFSGYQRVAGIAVPFHVQRYTNGSLGLDLVVETVSVNPSVSSADFQITQ